MPHRNGSGVVALWIAFGMLLIAVAGSGWSFVQDTATTQAQVGANTKAIDAWYGVVEEIRKESKATNEKFLDILVAIKRLETFEEIRSTRKGKGD